MDRAEQLLDSQGVLPVHRSQDRDRSRSPPRDHNMDVHESSSMRGTNNDDMVQILNMLSKEKLSKEMTTRVAMAMGEYKKSLSSTIKIKKKKAKITDTINKLLALRDPVDHKPFKSNDTEKFLDKPARFPGRENELTINLQNGCNATFNFVRTPTYRDVLRTLHYQYWGMVRMVECTMMEHNIDDLKPETSYHTFMAKCSSHEASVQSEISDLDLDLPDDMFAKEATLTESTAKSLIKRLVEDTIKESNDQKRKDEAAETRKLKAVEIASTLNPKTRLQQTVIETVKHAGFKGGTKGHGILSKNDGDKMEAEKLKKLANFDIDWSAINNGGDVQECIKERIKKPKRKWTKSELAKWKSDKLAKSKGKGNGQPNSSVDGYATKGKGPKGKGKGKENGKGKSKSKSKNYYGPVASPGGKKGAKGSKGNFHASPKGKGKGSKGRRGGKGK
mmetsp:Transcript_73083/g.133717  ORF Transcript_73083/g.133717 Transcript_73083/m.133717 type:complete len:447 (+) Transcript_73083:1480-2820(+)